MNALKLKTRRGRWTYQDHPCDTYGAGPGWVLDGTGLALDYDSLHGGASLRGCWILSANGRGCEPIDHYLDGSMRFVERLIGTPDHDRYVSSPDVLAELSRIRESGAADLAGGPEPEPEG